MLFQICILWECLILSRHKTFKGFFNFYFGNQFYCQHTALQSAATQGSNVLEGRSVRVCACAAAQGSGVLEGRSVRVCRCAAAQGSGVLEGRGLRVCVCAAAQGSGVLEGGVWECVDVLLLMAVVCWKECESVRNGKKGNMRCWQWWEWKACDVNNGVRGSAYA